MSRGPGPIPNRWLRCPRKSESLIADKFLAFKTPLKEEYESQMPIDCSFTPDMLFLLMKRYKAKIGLWIDLTNTSRFYDRTEIEDNGCQYVKLQCRGHSETPTMEQTKAFIEIVDQFTRDHPLEIVGVHCTHGFNRTGFLIVSYMVEKLDCSVEAAIAAFAAAREPGIYKEDYIRELFNRYEDGEDPIPAPPLPDWCLEYDDTSNNGHSSKSHSYVPADGQDDRDDQEAEEARDENEDHAGLKRSFDGETSQSEEQTGGSKRKKMRKEFVKKNAKFMDGVSGVTLVRDQPRLGELQQTIQNMCNWNSTGFPGCQPVSMDMTNINLLHQKPYMVSWKADGTRYMMLVLKKNEIFFFDRDNSCFEVSGISFPLYTNIHNHLTNTLLDGEMVIDRVNGEKKARYLVYDIIRYENEDTRKKPFLERLMYIEKRIVAPRTEAMKRGLIDQQQQPFSIRNKAFWDITQAKALLGPKFAKALSHDPDGLIFQPIPTPYVAGTCPEVLKWKPSTLNSVDFKLKIAEESGVGVLRRKIGLLFVGGLDTPFDKIKLNKELRELDNKIIECKYENNAWVFMRERTDKSFPNSFNTAKNVCHSIRYPVTTDILLDFIDKRRYREESSRRPPPPTFQE